MVINNSRTKWIVYLSRCVLYLLYEFLVFANFLYYFLIAMIFLKESINFLLSFSGDQKVILVIEFDVFDRCHALSHYHFLHLFFVGFNNFIQNYWLQGCWFRLTFLRQREKIIFILKNKLR